MKKRSLEELNRISVEAYQELPKYPVTLVLDNIRSLNNVGAAFRTADAFAIERIALCGITGIPPHRDIQKTALGATESVAWEYHEDIATYLQALKEQKVTLVAVEQTHSSTPLQNFVPHITQPFAFVFGNEVKGVSETALPHCDFSLEIPQFGTKHSLNVSVSIGIVLWHYVQQHLAITASAK